MSAEYDNLIADVATACPGALPVTIEAELALVLRDFCQVTNAWQQGFKIDVDTERLCYVITPQPGSAVSLLMQLYRLDDPNRNAVQLGGYNMAVPGVIELKRPSSQPDTWIAVVSLYPVRNISAGDCKALVPGWLLDRYYDAFQAGVKSRLMLQPAKTYTNIQLGMFNGRYYSSERAGAQADLARSNIWGTQQWQFPAATTARSRQVGP